jgi:hypothetical protein
MSAPPAARFEKRAHPFGLAPRRRHQGRDLRIAVLGKQRCRRVVGEGLSADEGGAMWGTKPRNRAGAPGVMSVVRSAARPSTAGTVAGGAGIKQAIVLKAGDRPRGRWRAKPPSGHTDNRCSITPRTAWPARRNLLR